MSGTGSQDNKMLEIKNEEELIKQTVDHGSIFLALDHEHIKYESLLNWLNGVVVTPLTKIAYKAVCTKIHPNKQYLNDGYHFLVKNNKYSVIAVVYGLNLEIPDQNIATCDNPVLVHICEQLETINDNSEDIKLDKLIVGINVNLSYDKYKLEISYKGRNFHHNPNLTAKNINTCLVEADWIEKFRYNENLPKLIIQRVNTLMEKAPYYYSQVAHKHYFQTINKLNKDKLLVDLTKDELLTINRLFPDIIDKRLLSYDGLEYKLALLGNDVAGYVLGFPIQNMIPSEDHIYKAIEKLKQDGIEKYAAYISMYMDKTYKIEAPFMSDKNISFVNDKDALLEDISNYSPFDVVIYQAGSYIYRFTRPEFTQMVESKKNHWTNEWLPTTVLSTVESRVKSVKELGLPHSRPLIELLKRVKDGKLFEPDKSENQPRIEHSNRQMELLNIFAQMLTGQENNGQYIILPRDNMEEDNNE